MSNRITADNFNVSTDFDKWKGHFFVIITTMKVLPGKTLSAEPYRNWEGGGGRQGDTGKWYKWHRGLSEIYKIYNVYNKSHEKYKVCDEWAFTNQT